MIRLSVLWVVVIWVGVVTWRDWFKGLCGLVILIGILEYPDVPKSMFGIPGLNFFNLLLLNVLLAWIAARSRERLTWDLPRHLSVLLCLYVVVILVGFYRMLADPGQIEATTSNMISEFLINTLKWIVPGLLLFHGCRSRERLRLATFALLGAYVFLALMTIKVMPLGSAFLGGDELQRLALKLLVNRIGYHRVTLSMMLGGAAWALIAAAPLVPDRRLRWAMPCVSLIVIYAQFLTGGRGGIVTLGVIGLVFGALKWRKVFLVAPFAIVLLYLLVPSEFQRLTQGFTKAPAAEGTTVDEYELTSGRNIIWPYVIAQIRQKPWIGWGRQAMTRTGTVAFLHVQLNEDFGHPHNAYLETLLDNGIIGAIPVLALFLTLLFHSLRLFLERRSALCTAAGGIAAATILALMVAGMSSQSFYPVEGTFEMWAAIGLMMRLSVERRHALAALVPDWSTITPLATRGRQVRTDAATLDLDALIFGGAGARPAPAAAAAPTPPLPRFSAGGRAAARPRIDPSAQPAPTVRFRF
jgi:O-antigen ligase